MTAFNAASVPTLYGIGIPLVLNPILGLSGRDIPDQLG